jgi:hypothetical protein
LPIARPERQAPKARARLEAFAEDYAKRQAGLGEAGEELRAERDRAVRAAYREGLPMRMIARVMKMSHQRVSQIIGN